MLLIAIRGNAQISIDPECAVETTDGRTIVAGSLTPMDLVRLRGEVFAVDERSWGRDLRASRRTERGEVDALPAAPAPVNVRRPRVALKGTAIVSPSGIAFPGGSTTAVRAAVEAMIADRTDEGEDFTHAARSVLATFGFAVEVAMKFQVQECAYWREMDERFEHATSCRRRPSPRRVSHKPCTQCEACREAERTMLDQGPEDPARDVDSE